MLLNLKRKVFTSKSTIGELWVDGQFLCYTLEDRVRDVKIQNETAIPEGTYDVSIDYSSKFEREMPHILSVPGYEGVRIHWGNTDKDTDGCVLVGMSKEEDFIGNSKKAFELLYPLIVKGLENNNRVSLKIEKDGV